MVCFRPPAGWAPRCWSDVGGRGGRPGLALWRSTSRSLTVGYGLIIGGALGNLIDRLLYGKVADFFHFYGFGYDWYVFNIADLAITLGAVAIIYDVLKPELPMERCRP